MSGCAPTAGALPQLLTYTPAPALSARPGLSAAQRTIAERLPLLEELFEAVLKPSCAKELEQMCASLGLLAGLLPALHADTVADWAVSGCERLSGLTQAATAKALLSLALRGKAAATEPGGGGGAADAAEGSQEGLADDLELLASVAADIKVFVNAGGLAGATEARGIAGQLVR
jgi:hypothetical protein